VKLALTFDDGPGPLTPTVLDLLAAHAARGTFFVVGHNVAGNEALLRRTLAEGHELGNHTFDHHDPRRLSDAELRDELRRTSEAVRTATGAVMRLARPPYGLDAERFERVAAGVGLRTVLWTVNPRDWLEPPAERLAARIVRYARDGAIVDLHDGRRAGQCTPDALALALPQLRDRGFRLVTVSELFERRPDPGG
jgi:peptidoglycan-N-acetylglucosamine deacetylase